MSVLNHNYSSATRFGFVLLMAALAGAGWPLAASAETTTDFLKPRTVRVVVRDGGDAKAATGFVWQSRDQVVTSLHALLPCEDCISVEFQGRTYTADIVKVLRDADLALLRTRESLQGSEYFAVAHTLEPVEHTRLHTWGYHAGGKGRQSRELSKKEAEPETLDGLVPPSKARDILKQFQIPHFDLDIYYVQKGLLPGFSGAAVIDDEKRLIGIVDGGLDGGQTGVNWVIPAGNLNRFDSSTATTVPHDVKKLGMLFASGIVDDDDENIIEYVEDDWHYKWTKAKTRTLDQLLFSSDDPDGLLELYEIFYEAAGSIEPEALQFDIYQEDEYGLIIAAPAGKILSFEELEGNEALYIHDAVPKDQWESAIVLEHQSIDLQDDSGKDVSPDDPDFFRLYRERIKALCEAELEGDECWEEYTRETNYENDSKILNSALSILVDGERTALLYSSVAVKDGQSFVALYLLSLEGDAGLLQCAFEEGNELACTDEALARRQFAMLMAASLTTFADLSRETEPVYAPAVTALEADNSQVTYFYENGAPAFQHQQDKAWLINIEGSPENATEIRREVWGDGGTYAILQYGTVWYAVPITGGQFFTFVTGGKWTPAFVVSPE